MKHTKVWRWVVWHLPRRLIYWCLIRAWAYATDERYNKTDANRVAMSTVIKRWEKQ